MKALVNYLDYQKRKSAEEHRHNAAQDRLQHALVDLQRRCPHPRQIIAEVNADETRIECLDCRKVL